MKLADGKIHRTSSGKLGTVPDFYSADMEKYLCNTIESQLGQFWVGIKDFADGKEYSVTVWAEEETAVKQLLYRNQRAR